LAAQAVLVVASLHVGLEVEVGVPVQTPPPLQ
jgi:hypothetical protein